MCTTLDLFTPENVFNIHFNFLENTIPTSRNGGAYGGLTYLACTYTKSRIFLLVIASIKMIYVRLIEALT